ncbi:hypothetical protein LTR78_009312 [Recurvomyces mirabilis]|uniref:Thiolase-like protein type 1 additional C-terminal domain-containing protein n=1 Tax=Recurvomyces mirabilis TaxID=574656 RepID=A0AAE0WIQ3_9PEZI|nr:hypothetical protein LTR78_009312 [Recurvomyces mirabilis]KAK5156127.1 hypothetical protein LTS14_005014 [Recurvomyces mirabilis]
MTRPAVPIIVGVGDVVNRSRKVEDAIEPLELMVQAIDKAFEDSGLTNSAQSSLQSQVDTLDVVRTWTWPYPDLPGLISKRIGAKPERQHYTDHGGNQPAYLLDEAARRISKGESKVAILTGGEALASLSACAAAKKLPPPGWTPLAEEVNSVFSPTTRELKPGALPGSWTPERTGTDLVDVGSKHSIGNPIHIYPLYENAYRAHHNQSIAENHKESAALYAEFAKVAEQNEYAWSHGRPADSAESIGAVSKKNRMICFPYPLLMNAFNTVNLAAACIVTSTEYARELGIPEEKWIYALGGAGTQDSAEFWKRPSFWWSPAISRSLDAGLRVSGLQKSDIDLYDFYSCFPIVPKLATNSWGMPVGNAPKPVTLLGGLTSFGGAGNNYSMHAITEMTRRLRSGRGKNGLILANGGVVTYQHVVCLSRSPRLDGLPYPNEKPLPTYVTDVQVPLVDGTVEGPATVETYTVEFGRDGRPAIAFIIGRLKSNGHRFIANHADEETLQACSTTEVEPIGRSGTVKTNDDGRNLFSFTVPRSNL